MTAFYEELEHTADWSIRVWGPDLEALFEHAAAAMFELSGADLHANPQVRAQIDCAAADLESLLVAWLNELLYLSETTDSLFIRFDVSVVTQDDGFRVFGHAQGVPGRGHLAHIKAVTYWDLMVQQKDHGWEAMVTFDT